MSYTCESCAKRATCRKDIGIIWGFCKVDYVPTDDEKVSANVYETDFGEVLCESCGASLECNECGDMPEICPKCGAFLSYGIYEEASV